MRVGSRIGKEKGGIRNENMQDREEGGDGREDGGGGERGGGEGSEEGEREMQGTMRQSVMRESDANISWVSKLSHFLSFFSFSLSLSLSLQTKKNSLVLTLLTSKKINK